MRILWVSPHCWPDYVLRSPGLGTKSQGGQTVVMYHCPRSLTEVNPDLHVDIYARMETGEPEVVHLGERVRLIRCLCGDPDTYIPKEQFWDGPIQQFVDEVDSYARRHGLAYDLVHGHYADGWYSAHHLAERWGVPYCLTTHSLGRRKRANCLAMNEASEEELDQTYAFSVRIDHEESALAAAGRIFPLTEEEGEYLLEHYQCARREQIRAIPNGILLADFHPRDEAKAADLRARLGIADDEAVVLQAGRVDPRKGQRELLAAAPAVLEAVEQWGAGPVRFLLVGWTEDEFAEGLERGVREAGIEDRVILHPPVGNRDMPPYFHLADVYAHTSTYDILPIVILEAMASRLGVVASKNGGASEILDTGTDGLLVDPYEIAEVRRALVRLLGDAALRRRMGEAAFRKVRERYTWQKVAERLNRQYAEILEDARR